jgi:hypothetical protein
MSALRRQKSDAEHYRIGDLTREFGVTLRTPRRLARLGPSLRMRF